MEKTVLLIVEINEYEDGVFIESEEWKKVKLNQIMLQKEIELLRIELSKFEGEK